MMPQCVARLSAPFTPPRPPAVTQRRTISCRSYSAPETYDIAFSFRDFESEVAFLLDAHQTHTNAPLKRFLEVGCGPARHSLLLAQAAGAQCTGLDLSFEMLEYAAQRAQQAGVESKVAFVRGNMADPGGIAQLIPGGEVDMAAVLLGTLSHCLDNQAALQCFRNLAQ